MRCTMKKGMRMRVNIRSHVGDVGKTYPYFGMWKHGRVVVLFAAASRGMVVAGGRPAGLAHCGWAIGDYRTDWQEASEFTPFWGTLEVTP